MARPTHLVLRVLPGSQGRDIYGGTLVDASSWANTRLLEGTGHLRRLTPEELEVAPDLEEVQAEEVESQPQAVGESSSSDEAQPSANESSPSEAPAQEPASQPEGEKGKGKPRSRGKKKA